MNYKPLFLIAEKENGEVVAIKVTEDSIPISTDNADVPLGSVVEVPTPKQVKLQEELARPDQNVQAVLDKYKTK